MRGLIGFEGIGRTDTANLPEGWDKDRKCAARRGITFARRLIGKRGHLENSPRRDGFAPIQLRKKDS